MSKAASLNSKNRFFLLGLFFITFFLFSLGCERRTPPAPVTQNTPASVSVPQNKTTPNSIAEQYLQSLPRCKDFGLLDQSSCADCNKNQSSQCIVVQRSQQGSQCYECVKTPETYAD